MSKKKLTRQEASGPGSIEQAVSVFSLGALQEYVTIHRHLSRRGIELEQVRSYLKNRIRHAKKNAKQSQVQARIWLKYGPKCPDCKTVLTLRAGDDNDCHLTCYQCRWGGYDPRPAKEVWDAVIRKAEEIKNG